MTYDIVENPQMIRLSKNDRVVSVLPVKRSKAGLHRLHSTLCDPARLEGSWGHWLVTNKAANCSSAMLGFVHSNKQ